MPRGKCDAWTWIASVSGIRTFVLIHPRSSMNNRILCSSSVSGCSCWMQTRRCRRHRAWVHGFPPESMKLLICFQSCVYYIIILSSTEVIYHHAWTVWDVRCGWPFNPHQYRFPVYTYHLLSSTSGLNRPLRFNFNDWNKYVRFVLD